MTVDLEHLNSATFRLQSYLGNDLLNWLNGDCGGSIIYYGCEGEYSRHWLPFQKFCLKLLLN